MILINMIYFGNTVNYIIFLFYVILLFIGYFILFFILFSFKLLVLLLTLVEMALLDLAKVKKKFNFFFF